MWPGRLRIVSIQRVFSTSDKTTRGVTALACYRWPNKSSPHPGVLPTRRFRVVGRVTGGHAPKRYEGALDLAALVMALWD